LADVENFVTMFDSSFLPQGLALHSSMAKNLKDYRLWVLCLDDAVYVSLKKLDLYNVRLLHLFEVENDELKLVKSNRSKVEYYWTLTPFAPRFVFNADQTVQRVTYLDADMWFIKSPTKIFREFDLSGKNVLITDHSYGPEYDRSNLTGKFCVQFLTFERVGGEVVRKHWEKQCLEWCFSRHENGKFGDQKYLDDWPERFADEVHVLADKELILAPWNATRFPYGNALVWHFHGLRIEGNRIRWFLGYQIPRVVIDQIYGPYVRMLEHIIKEQNIMVVQGTPLTYYQRFRTWLGAIRMKVIQKYFHHKYTKIQ
jgi:hypothetical protein